jgi:ribosomal protein S12 methylthiotransferase
VTDTQSAGARFAIITLGCPKNEADSDSLAALLRRSGHVPWKAEAADAIIVNTCGFIDAAKEESIGVILDAAAVAATTGARVVVAGCLVSLYRDELERELPEVDLFIAFEHGPLLALLDELAVTRRRTAAPAARAAPRSLHAFVKISDGCDQRCAFCAIPLIKGAYEVVPPADILAAAERALAAGARELVLVGQDTSRWAWPGYGGLRRLLRDLKALGAVWLRLLYLQPQGVDDALLDALAEHAVPYVDLPLQHADATVLRRMGRAGDGIAHLRLLEHVRARLPRVAVRSTFLVGHPGETDAAFANLEDFVAAAELAVAGVFVFDPQQGTRAAASTDRVPAAIAERRAARLSEVIETASRPFWESLTGTTLDVLIERGTGRSGEAVGRIPYQAPDVDGQTFICGRALRRGALVRARLGQVTG